MDQPISRGNPRGEKPENGQEALATLKKQCEDDQRPRTTCTLEQCIEWKRLSSVGCVEETQLRVQNHFNVWQAPQGAL